MRPGSKSLKLMLAAVISSAVAPAGAEDTRMAHSSLTLYEVKGASDITIDNKTEVWDAAHNGSLKLGLSDGARIIVKKGGCLTFRGNCQFYVAPNTTLVIEPGGKVTMQGSSALQIQKSCVIGNGKSFVLEKQTALSSMHNATVPTVVQFFGNIFDVDKDGNAITVACPACGGG